MLDSKMVAVLAKFPEALESIHFSDQYTGLKPPEDQVISVVVLIRGALPIFRTTKTSVFSKAHNKGLRMLFLMVSWDLCA